MPREARTPAIREEAPSAAARSQVTPRTIWTIALHVCLLAAVLAVLHGARGVLEWVLVALFLAVALDPAVRFFERRRIRRPLGVGLVMLGVVGILALSIGTLIPMLIEQGKSLVEATPRLLERLRESETIAALDRRVDIVGRAQRELGSYVGNSAGPVVRAVGGFLRSLGAAVAIAVLTAFMLLFGGALFESALRWVPPDKREHSRQLVGRIQQAVGGYVSGTLLVALIGGVMTTLLLLLLGVPYFLPLGLAMMVLGVVPFLGAWLGGALVVVTTFLSSGLHKGLIALVVFLVYQQVENHLLQPLIQRRTIKMNPLAIALVMLIGTAFAGVLGALVALPLAAAAYILLEDLVGQRRGAQPSSG